MKILVFSQHYWPENFRINEVAATLVDQGHDVDVLTGKPNYPGGDIFPGYRAGACLTEQHAGVNISRVPLLGRGRGALRLALNYLAFIVSGMLYAPKLLRKKQFDVIFVFATSPILQALPALFLGRLRKIPVVIWVQDLWPESLSATGYVKNRHALALVAQVVKFIYARASLLLVQSEAFMVPVTAYAKGTPVRYLPNSIDLASQEGKPDAGLDPALFDGFVVMFTGNIGAAQAMDVVLDAADLLRDLPEVRLVIIGDGSKRQWTVEQACARGLNNLALPGAFPISSMGQLMARASVLMVTLADQEVFNKTVPSKIQAYLAAGRPIVGSLNGEGARLIELAGAGCAASAGDPVALAEAIRSLHARSAADLDAMGRNGRRYFDAHFAHASIVAQLVDHLDSCLKKEKETVS